MSSVVKSPLKSPWDATGVEARDRDVAVVGMAGRFPGARDLDEFWTLLAEGREAITHFSDDELRAAGVPDSLIAHPDYVKAGSRLDGVEEFAADFFGYTAREAEIMDPQQRLFLEHSWTALEDAGVDPATYPGLIGTYAGVAWNTYLLSNLREHPELFDGGGAFQVFITNDKDFMPTRVAYKLDLKGPAMIVQTSCSTSLVAIHLAALSLLNYECDMALAGGVTVKVPQEAGYFYQDGGLASPDGHCRAFDERAAGTVFGSGVGVVALKRMADALEDGDTIRAVLRGSAINNDGSLKVSYTAPSVEGQAEVVAAAQAVADVDPRDVGFVECHGTGTSLGDPIEVTALKRVFREGVEGEAGDGGAWDGPRCALGSVKSNVGHLDAAAGVAGFLKTVLGLEHRQIPPVVGFETPNPRLELEASPFRVAAGLADWPAPPGGGPRLAGVSSFGVGGTNAHAVVEEAPAPPKPAPARRWQLLPLSAQTRDALDAATARLGAALADGVPAGGSLADVAWTLTTGRRAFAHRRFLIAADAADAAERLGGEAGLPTGCASAGGSTGSGDQPTPRPVAFLLPGQGAQHPGMARKLYEEEPVFRDELDRCAGLLRPHLLKLRDSGLEDAEGGDLVRLLYPASGGDEDAAAARLRRTAIAQPALFAVEWSLARLWASWGVEPVALLGHSLGEWVAAALAGVVSLQDALGLVATRGRLMQAAEEGDMLAVPLSADEVKARLEAAGGFAGDGEPGVELAAINQPDRVTVAGPAAAVAAFAEALAAEGVDARPLHTSHAFHSASMDAAVEPFRRAVAEVELSAPQVPFISNLTGTWITDAEATSADYWAHQLRGTVRFAEGLEALLADEERVLLEVGPGDTLTTLARRSSPGAEAAGAGRSLVRTLPHPRQAARDGRSGDAQAAALEALGRLWMAGVEIDWRGFFAGEARRRLPLPTYPFERRRYWIGAGPAAGRRPGTAAALAGVEACIEGDDQTEGKRPDPASWLYRAGWREAPLAVDAMAVLAGLGEAEAGSGDDGDGGRAEVSGKGSVNGSDLGGATGGRPGRGNGAASAARPWWLITSGDDDGPDAALADALQVRLAAAGVPVQRVAEQRATEEQATEQSGPRQRVAEQDFTRNGAAEPADASGLEARGEGRWALRGDAADDWAALAGTAGGAPRAVLHLAGLSVSGDGLSDVADASRDFRGLAALVEGVRRHDGDAPLDLTLVSPGLFQVTALEALRPAAAVALGAIRVLPEEAAGVHARAVDPGRIGFRPGRAVQPSGDASGDATPPTAGDPAIDRPALWANDDTSSELALPAPASAALDTATANETPASQQPASQRITNGGATNPPSAEAGFAADRRWAVDRLADRLLAEVAAAVTTDTRTDATTDEIALRGGQRWVRHYRPATAGAAPAAATPGDGVWLLSGRLSGDALTPARHLAARGARIALLASAEDAAAGAAGEELSALGAEVETVTADPLDAAAVTEALEAVRRRFGDLDGVLHSVGGDGVHLHSDLATAGGDADPVADHLRPVATLDVLHRALAAGGHRPATALVASSLASLLGGLANGAATAAALAAGAWVEERSRRREARGEAGPAWLALDLDPWAVADGPTPGAATTPYTLTADDFGTVLDHALDHARAAAAGGRLLVSTGSLARRLAERRERLAAHGGATAAGRERHPRPDLDVPFAAPESDLERRIAEVWSELLGFDRIGLDDNFFELGGDSFVAVRVASRLKDALGTELPVAQLYEALTVRALARLVEETAGRHEEREAHLEERRQADDRRRDRLARRRERMGASR